MSEVDNKIEEVAGELRTFIAGELGREGISNLSNKDDPFAGGVLDSMDVVAIISFCETRYNIVIDFSSISEKTFSSLDSVASLILECMAS